MLRSIMSYSAPRRCQLSFGHLFEVTRQVFHRLRPKSVLEDAPNPIIIVVRAPLGK